jgi:hypothetical protein
MDFDDAKSGEERPHPRRIEINSIEKSATLPASIHPNLLGEFHDQGDNVKK